MTLLSTHNQVSQNQARQPWEHYLRSQRLTIKRSYRKRKIMHQMMVMSTSKESICFATSEDSGKEEFQALIQQIHCQAQTVGCKHPSQLARPSSVRVPPTAQDTMAEKEETVYLYLSPTERLDSYVECQQI